MAVQNEQELVELFNDPLLEGLLLETGYSKPLTMLHMDDQNGIISSVIDYHCMIKVKAAIDQFTEGLKEGSVYDSLMAYPDLFMPFFVLDHLC